MTTTEENKTQHTSAPRRSFETWAWFFMRISGLVLIFLALVHFTITHIVNDVAETDYNFVVQRWDNPVWRIFDWTLLALGLLHGLNGVRVIIDDYASTPRKRVALKALVYGLTAVLFGYGTLTILTFS